MQRKGGEAKERNGDKRKEKCKGKDEERKTAGDLKVGLTKGSTGARQAGLK